MIEYRPGCENCDKDLPVASTDAMICAFECTFCRDCVTDVLHNVCPNCTGGFQQRPVLVKKYISRYPPAAARLYKPVDLEEFNKKLKQYKNIPPQDR